MNRNRPASAPLPEVPSDDGTIGRALESVDVLFGAWRTAMECLHAPPIETAAAVEPPAVEATDGTASPEPPLARPARRGVVVYEQPAAEAEAPDAAAPRLSEEEQALLATLDPETAQQVRMMRRLRGSRTTLAELVEEVRAKDPAASAAGRKKSWWRKGST